MPCWLAGTCLFVALLPVSPMYRNQQAVARNAQRKQAQIDALIALDERKALDDHLQGQALRLARLERAYHAYLGGLVDRFGLEAVAEQYQYSESAAQVADVRLKRLNFCHLLMEESPPLTRWFGLELADLNENGYNYDVENDFHGAYYLCGYTGLALLLSFLAFYILRIFPGAVPELPPGCSRWKPFPGASRYAPVSLIYMPLRAFCAVPTPRFTSRSPWPASAIW